MNCPICKKELNEDQGERLLMEKVKGREYFITLHLKPCGPDEHALDRNKYGQMKSWCSAAGVSQYYLGQS